VRERRVIVNGEVCKRSTQRVLDTDTIVVDGSPVRRLAARLWRYHKPPGLLVSHGDPQGRRTVFDDVHERVDRLPRLVSVGRLDAQTEGLLLLTNLPSVARHFEHPQSGYTRQYIAQLRLHDEQSEDVAPTVTSAMSDALRAGVLGFRPIHVEPLDSLPATLARPTAIAGPCCYVSASVTEGKKHEVRRAFHHLGFRVPRLIRVAFGPFALGGLEPGGIEEVATDQAAPWQRLRRECARDTT
jgi:23S rRNA pseudouridine2605 synthase